MKRQERKKILVFFGAPHTTLGYLGVIAEWLRRFELLIFIIPWLSLALRRHQVKVCSSDSAINAFLAKRGFAPFLKGSVFGVNPNPRDYDRITRFAKNWYKDDKLENALTFKGVNIAAAQQSDTMSSLLGLTEKMRFFETVIQEEAPALIRAADMEAGEAQALRGLCASHKIDFAPLCPRRYERIKMWIVHAVKCAREKIGLERVSLFEIANENIREPYRGTVLIDAPYANYLSALIPLVEQLHSKKLAVYALAAKQDLQQYCHSFTKIKYDKKPTKESRKSNDRIRNCALEIKKKPKGFRFNGVNASPIIEFNLCRAQGLVSYLERFERVVSAIRPDILLVGDDTPAFVRTHVVFAQKKGVPVVEVQHGVYLESTLSDLRISDKICLWGSISRDIFTKQGLREDRLEITGNPKFDRLIQLAQKRELTPVSSRKILLFATQGLFLNLNLAVIRTIGASLLTQDNIILKIKPHPIEDDRVYQAVAKEFPNKVFVNKATDNTQDLLLESDALIVISSSVAIDAAILDKPIICIDYSSTEPIYVSKRVAVNVKSLDELVGSILDVLYNADVQRQLAEAREKFVHEFAYLQDGNASKRIVEVICGVITQGTQS